MLLALLACVGASPDRPAREGAPLPDDTALDGSDPGDTDPDDTGAPYPAGLTVLDAVAVVDASGRREGRAVLLLDGRIERETEAGGEWPADATVIDGGGGTVIPGLVDAHVHLATAGTTAHVGDMLDVNLRATLAAGVTEVVDLGGPLSLFALRDAIARGDAVGPRIHAAGPFLTAVGSHPCETFPDPTLCTFVDATDAAGIAAARVTAGADVLKVALADASFTPWGATPRLDLDALDAVVATGAPVWAHVDEDEDVIDAVDHGVSVLTHPVFAGPMGPDALAAAARAVAVTSTVSAFANVGRLGALQAPHPAIQANWDAAASDLSDLPPGFAEESAAWAAYARDNLEALRGAGARVLPGSDAGYYFVPHGTGLLDELDALVGIGWAPLEALTAATLDARLALGADGGLVEAGAPADLVLVDGDPSTDLAALRRVAAVFVGGRRFDADADLVPLPIGEACLEDADCPAGEACDAYLHACGGACPVPGASVDPCGPEAWCMPTDGLDAEDGVCHDETSCDLYAQDCAPELYGLACVPYDGDTSACWYGGPRRAGDACAWDDPAAACAPGLLCSTFDARCYTLCDPDGPDTCPTGRCRTQRTSAGDPWFGLCD